MAFSAGSVFVNLGAHLAREGFQGFNQEVAGAQKVKEHYVRLGGNLTRTGFEGYRRLLAQSAASTKEFEGTAVKSFDSVNISMKGTAEAAAHYLGSTRAQLGLLRGEYMTVAEAAEHSATMQRHAMESAVPAASAMEAKGAAAGRAASGGFNKEFRKAADVGKVGAIGAAVVGGVSAKWATDFQKNMMLLRTEAGYTINGKGNEPGVKQLSKAVLDLAPQTGFGPSKLAEGLYHIASAGIPASKAMDTLKVAAEGARIGNSNMNDVSRALSAIMETNTKDIHSAAEAMGVLVKIVGRGNLRMKDLIAAMGTGVVPAGKAVGLGLRDVGVALDVLTARGVPAEQAATRLRTTLSLMANPTHKAEEALAQVGLSHDAVAKAFRGNAEAMSKLGISHEKLKEAFTKGGLIGGLETIRTALDKTFPKGEKLAPDQYKEAVARYNDQLDALGVTGRAREKDMNNFKSRLKEVGSAAIEQNQVITNAFGGARMGTTMEILMQNLDDARIRMAKIGTTSKGAVGELNSAVADYQKTAAFQFQQFWASVQKLGIELGDRLLPMMIRFVHTLEDVGHFLGQHKVLADALAITFGGALLIAIGAWVLKVIDGFKKSAKSLFDFTTQLGGLRGKYGQAATAAEESSTAQVAAIDKVTTAIEEQTVAMVNAQSEYGRLAITGESVTAGGAVLPKSRTYKVPLRIPGGQVAGAGETLLAEEEAALAGGGAGRLGGAKNLLGKVAGRAGSGLMIGLGGTLAAQMAGGIIGGNTGSAVSGIGSGVATGAGIGMLLGPEGALAGGAIGGIVAGFSHFLGGNQAEEFGKKTAKQFEHGMGMLHLNISAPTAAHTQKVVEETGKQIRQVEDKAQPHLRGGRGRGAAVAPAVTPGGLTPEERKQIQDDYDKMGRAAAQSFNEGMMHGPKYQTEGTMLGSFKIALNSLPPQARKSALESMLKMSATLEQEGRLPKGATDKLVQDIIKTYGYLSPQLKAMTHNAMKDIETEIQQGKAVDQTQQMVDQIGKTFAGAPKVGKVNAHNVRKVWEEEMGFLKDHMHTGTVGMQEDAASLWAQMHADAKKYSKLMRVDVDKEINTMASSVSGSMGDMSGAVDDAVTSISTAANTIASNINKLSKEMGAKGIAFTPAKTPRGRQKQSNVLGSHLPSATTELGAPVAVGGGFAVGGIPNPAGSAHDDHVIVGPHGPIGLVSGTEGIINRPQMDVVDASLHLASQLGLHQYGSLDSLWSSGMRHYAEGGILDRANALDRMHLPYVWGGHHGERGAITNPRPGLDCSSTVSYVLGIPPRVSGAMAGIGQPGPGAITVYYNDTHTFMKIFGRYFGTSGFGHPKAGTGPAWFTSQPDAGYLHGFQARHVNSDFGMTDLLGGSITGPPGAMKDIATAAVNREARQGRSYITGLLGKLDNAAGQGLDDGSGTAAAPDQAKRWIRQAMALAGVGGSLWEQMLIRQARNESSFIPTAVNTTDVNAAHGDPSRGFMQITGSNFRTYLVPGHGNINNPVDNTAAAIKYIIATYGKGNASKGAQVMWARGGGAYTLGGLLRRFQTGGRLGHDPRAHTSSTHPPRVGVIPRSSGSRIQRSLRPASKKKLPIARAHSGPQVLPHSLGNLSKFADLPGIGPLDDADTAIKAIDSQYSSANRYFSIVDAQLTPDDLGQLIGLRTQQGTALQAELGLEQQAGADLNVLAVTNDESLRIVKTQAQSVLGHLNELKARLKREGERLARLRHVRAGHMLTIADNLAKKIRANADHRAKLGAQERQVRKSYEDRIARVLKAKPADITNSLNAVDKKYAGTISYHQKYSPSKIPGIRRQIKAEKDALRRGHKSALDAHSGQVRKLIDDRRNAIFPLEKQRANLVDNARHLSEDEAAQRRKYQRKGWHDVWAITTKKWDLQGSIDTLRQQEKDLTGSTTEIGSGGELGKLVQRGTDIAAAQEVVKGRETTTQQDILDNALNDLDLAGQQAQSVADRDKKETDLSDYLPPGVADILTRAADAVPPGLGISKDDIHRKYEPSDTAAAGGAPSPADVAAAAIAQLASLESASRQLYTQFGSNMVGADDRALQGALAGAPFGGGARFFGAAGPSINAGVGLGPTGVPLSPGEEQGGSNVEQNFYQTNHYATGPEDPHIHAQASRAQFETTFG